MGVVMTKLDQLWNAVLIARNTRQKAQREEAAALDAFQTAIKDEIESIPSLVPEVCEL
jgi:hypothetical protein